MYLSIDETKFRWKKGDKSMRFLARMRNKKGAKYVRRSEADKNGYYVPLCVFKVCSMEEILSVESKLENI